MTSLATGDLEGAKEFVRTATRGIDPAAVAAFFGNFYDLGWVLDREGRERLLRLAPANFGNDRGTWGLALALQHNLDGDRAKARERAEDAVEAYRRQLAGAPENAAIHSSLGLALALSGDAHRTEAIAEGLRATVLAPLGKDLSTGPYCQHALARIYILTNEPEKALDRLEPLLEAPYYLTKAWMRIDPNFTPLRGNPRFQKLVR